MSDVLFDAETDTQISTGDGDHDRFSHYVPKEQVMEGLVYGKPVVALCGKTWVPSRDPEKYKVCPTCKKLYKELSSNGTS